MKKFLFRFLGLFFFFLFVFELSSLNVMAISPSITVGHAIFEDNTLSFMFYDDGSYNHFSEYSQVLTIDIEDKNKTIIHQIKLDNIIWGHLIWASGNTHEMKFNINEPIWNGKIYISLASLNNCTFSIGMTEIVNGISPVPEHSLSLNEYGILTIESEDSAWLDSLSKDTIKIYPDRDLKYYYKSSDNHFLKGENKIDTVVAPVATITAPTVIREPGKAIISLTDRPEIAAALEGLSDVNSILLSSGTETGYLYQPHMENLTFSLSAHKMTLIPKKDSACEDTGYLAYYKCTSCNKYYEDSEHSAEILDIDSWKQNKGLIPISHNNLYHKPRGTAYCNRAAIKSYYHCIDCDRYFEDADCLKPIVNISEWKNGEGNLGLDPTNHFLNGQELRLYPSVPATCTEDGIKEYYYCTRCYKYFSDSDGLKYICARSETDKLATWEAGEGLIPRGHKKAKNISTKRLLTEATCTNSATYYYECEICQKQLDETFSYGLPKGHIEVVDPEVKATCISAGKTEGKHCSVCNETLVEQVSIPAGGHSFINVVVSPASIKSDGLSIKKCSICDEESEALAIPRAYVVMDEDTVKYTGKDIKPAIRVITKDGQPISKSNYIVTYKNNKKIGAATATITFKDYYTGSAKKTFNIVDKKLVPAKVSNLKVTGQSKELKVTWKKLSANASGYEIQYATDANFLTAGKPVKISQNDITSATIKKLKSKTKYYVRIRSYNKSGKTIAYSSWAKIKKAVKTK